MLSGIVMGSLIKLYGFGYKNNTFAASSSIFDKNIQKNHGIIYMIILSYFLNIIIRKHTWFSF